MIISTANIYKALTLYLNKGYEMVDIPYVVEEEVSLSTIRTTKEVNDLYYKDKVYVASAEQSFKQLYKDTQVLEQGCKYMALSPCYRTEPLIDETHYNLFLKLELIYIGEDLECLVEDAYNVLNEFVQVHKVPTSMGMDLYCGDIEIGSYGLAKFDDGQTYTYATGYTDPRMSICIAKEIRRGKQ